MKKSQTLSESVRHFDELPDSAHVRAPDADIVLGISRTKRWRMIKDGRLPSVKVDRMLMIPVWGIRKVQNQD